MKGRRKEYTVRKKLMQSGWDIAQRSAGSHSPVDIFAIHKELRQIKFIQCKPLNFPKSQEEQLMKAFNWLKGKFEVSFEVI